MHRWKVTNFFLVPPMILQLVNSPGWAKADTSTIENTATGAAVLPSDLSAKFQSKMKSTLFTGYGSSETVRFPFPLSTFLRDLHVAGTLQTLSITATMRENCIPGYKPTPGSVGLLMAGMEARIIREDGTEGGIGEVGELWVRGDSVFSGYFNDKQATAMAFSEDGWFKTGDIFTVDEKQVF